MKAIVLVDCDNVSHRHFSAARFSGWETAHYELAGRAEAVRPWKIAIKDKFTQATVSVLAALDASAGQDAADAELCMRVGQLVALKAGGRPARVMILGRDHIYRQPVTHLNREGIPAWLVDPVPGVNFGSPAITAYQIAQPQSQYPEGWVPLHAIGFILKEKGVAIRGKLLKYMSDNGFQSATDNKGNCFVRLPLNNPGNHRARLRA
jgi:hypothetical protein